MEAAECDRSEFWPSQFAKPDVPFCLAHVTISVVNIQVEDSCHCMVKPKQLKCLQYTKQNSQHYWVIQRIGLSLSRQPE